MPVRFDDITLCIRLIRSAAWDFKVIPKFQMVVRKYPGQPEAGPCVTQVWVVGAFVQCGSPLKRDHVVFSEIDSSWTF